MSRFLTKLVGGVPARRATKGAPRQHRRTPAPRLRIEALDERCGPAAFTVTNTGDNSGVNPAAGAGTGTFRQALVDAIAATTADQIVFDTAGVLASPQTINLEAVLPTITTAGGAL